MLDIVYEDEHLLVLDKPSGVLSQPGKEIDGSIATQAIAAFPEATGPMLVHRLDMDTSGLMVLAKQRTIHRQLQQLFEHRLVGKRYVAVLSDTPVGMGGIIALPLRADIDNRPHQIVCHEHGKHCSTLWRLIDRQPGQARVSFNPLTGRTHQLRVHSAATTGLACPIVGDRLYGQADQRLMLHANILQFRHPVTSKPLKIESETPF